MPAIIRVLDDLTINKIAAGEVIENPSSVVKELVENALDAKANEVIVEIEAGGRSRIKVSDNGIGMVKDDALLSLERHATSKLKNIDDLMSLDSMGFRGEALPSIASISKLNLLTSDEKGPGTFIKVEGGKFLVCKEAPRARGTTFDVQDLFYNVPVRRKFLKSPTVDENEIVKCLTRVSLAHPDKKFHLIFNQKTEFLLYPSTLIERIEKLLGSSFTKDLIPVKKETAIYKISGYVGKANVSRPNRSGQILILNDRPVTSPFIAWCVKEAFHTHLGTGRYPIFVLSIQLPADEIDVNVHPQKQEVRLRNENEIKRILFSAVQEALSENQITAPTPWALERVNECFQNNDDQKDVFNQPARPKTYTPSMVPLWEQPRKLENKDVPLSVLPPIFPWETHDRAETSDCKETSQVQTGLKQINHEQTLFSIKQPNRAPLKILTTLKGLIVAERPFEEGLILIDQEKAHARILFEKFQKGLTVCAFVETTVLLIPITIQLTKSDMALIKEHDQKFKVLGFEIQEFGPHVIAVNAYPSLYKKEELEKILFAYIDEIKMVPNSPLSDQTLKTKLSEKASSLSIGNSKCLTLQEASLLVEDLFLCDKPFESPLGKPTVITLNREDLARQFLK